MRYLTLIFTFLFSITGLFAQKEYNNWYFGYNSGITFNSGAPVAVAGGIVNTAEGVASISDQNGNLLFYTDGVTVFDRNHDTLSNGKGLRGNATTSQSASIVPLPGSSTIYYIFTIDYQMNPTYGLTYSILDITQNGGLGSITSKNNFLLAPVTERQTQVLHADSLGIWVIVQQMQTNNFYAYLLTKNGICDPVITPVGSTHTGLRDALGELKASPDGKRIAYANNGWNGSNGLGFIELFDFDASTGILTNPINLYLPEYPYGVCFSPDNTKIYAGGGQNPRKLYQYDISSGVAATINTTKTLLYSHGTSPTGVFGSIQLAPDGRVVVGHTASDTLGVVNNPNVAGVGCSYNHFAIPLTPGTQCMFGLPAPIVKLDNPKEVDVTADFTYSNTCVDLGVNFTDQSSSNTTEWSWNFGDNTSASNTSALQNPSHSYSEVGTFTVTLIAGASCTADTFMMAVIVNDNPFVPFTADTLICLGEQLVLNAGSWDSYLWNTGDVSPAITVSPISDALYTVALTSGPCATSFSISVIVAPTPVAEISNDTSFYIGDIILLTGSGGYNILWSTGATTGNITVMPSTSSVYTMTVTTGTCTDTASVRVTLLIPDYFIPSSFTPNNDGNNDVFEITGGLMESVEGKIYDRWGGLVYSWNSVNGGWDGFSKGRRCQEDTYIYILKIKQVDSPSTSITDKITLIR